MTADTSVVVIMAKQPAVGRTKTRLCPPLEPAQAAALYEAMLLDTIALVAALDTAQLAIAVTPPESTAYFRSLSPPGTLLLPVVGADIGDCLDQILSRLLAMGYAHAVALNSDGPTLPLATLRRALALLDRSDVVLGPGQDGGYYLIGLKQPQPGLFRDITWSTARVAAQTLTRAAEIGLSVSKLPAWYDIDTGADLERLRRDLEALPPTTAPHTRRFLAAST